jgi:hypothetical protein
VSLTILLRWRLLSRRSGGLKFLSVITCEMSVIPAPIDGLHRCCHCGLRAATQVHQVIATLNCISAQCFSGLRVAARNDTFRACADSIIKN